MAVAAIVVHNGLVAVGITEAQTVAVNLTMTAGLVVLARRSGRSLAELGLRVRARGLRTAGLAGAAALAVVVLAAATGRLPVDATITALTGPAWWFRVLVAIPVGTAVCEEVLFRGVILAAWAQRVRPVVANVATSALFGLWHVAAETSRTASFGLVVVPGVIATACASAFVLVPLRRRGGDLAAPIAVHAVINVGILVAVHLAG